MAKGKVKRKHIACFTIILTLLLSVGIPISASDNVLNNQGIPTFETLEFDPKSHDFGDMFQAQINSTIFYIWKGGGCCELTYWLSTTYSWLDVFPTSGTSNGEHDPITVTIDTTGLSCGIYTGSIHIDSSAGTGDFMVTVNVIPSGNQTLAFYPQEHDFGTLTQGITETSTFEIWNCGEDTLNYTLLWNAYWLGVSPDAGQSTGEHDTITIEINTAGLDLGETYETDIQIETNGGSGVFHVTVTVDNLPRFEIGEIIGGPFRIKTTLKNVGDATAYKINWSIKLTGIGFLLMGQKTSDTLFSLPVGEETTLTSNIILGLGNLLATVSVENHQKVSATKTADAKVLLFFIKIS